jgi:hypothetical protein
MLKPRPCPTIARLGATFAAIAAWALLGGSAQAAASVVGFTGNPVSALLGHPLDFAVGVKLEGG